MSVVFVGLILLSGASSGFWWLTYFYFLWFFFFTRSSYSQDLHLWEFLRAGFKVISAQRMYICGCRSSGGTATQHHFTRGLFQTKRVMWILTQNLHENVLLIEFSKGIFPFHLVKWSPRQESSPAELFQGWDFPSWLIEDIIFWGLQPQLRFPDSTLQLTGPLAWFPEPFQAHRTQALGLLALPRSSHSKCQLLCLLTLLSFFLIISRVQDLLPFFFLLRCVCKDVCRYFI